MIVNYR